MPRARGDVDSPSDGAAAQALGLGLRGRGAHSRPAARRRGGHPAPGGGRLRPAPSAGSGPGWGFASPDPALPVALEAVPLPPPRLNLPAALAGICSTDVHDRASHAYGKAYRDLVRGFRGRFDHPPDVVAFPGHERELEALLERCEGAGAAVVPYGGGTSVVGGLEVAPQEARSGVVSVDLGRLDRGVGVDGTPRAARLPPR